MGKVIFTSRRPLGRCENITAIYKAYPGEKVFFKENWAKGWTERHKELFDPSYTLMVADDFVPYSPGKLILVTHGASGGKTYGLMQPHGYHTRKDAALITWVVATSEDMIELEAKQHGVDVSQVLPLGMPRFDYYFGKKKGDGGTGWGTNGERVYLVVPTHRNPYVPPFPDICFSGINWELQNDEVLLVKRHMVFPYALLHGANYRRVRELDPKEPSRDYLIDADVIITDYSSILFDAHALGKPLILFEKNKGYLETRGMSDPYPEGYSSRYCTTEEELIEMMRDSVGGSPGPEDIACWERHCGACDGHATERVVDLIRSEA